MKQFSDNELYDRIKNGNQEAFELVFLRYYEELCRYATNILGNKEASEEIVQDVFVKMWETRVTIKIDVSLKAYLYRTIHNYCINQINHWKVRDQYAKDVMHSYHANFLQSIPFTGDYPIANLIVKELEEKIETSINALPNQCREVFLLIREKELSYQEVADQLNVSLNTVKTQMQRAMSKLREMLKDYLPVINFF